MFHFISLHFISTKVNYQYRNGTSFPVALRTLYADGGIPRFYRGVLPALFQGPLSRFGDTAANTGVLTFLNSMDQTKDLSVGLKTIAASASAGLFRICIMPIDTVKTVRRWFLFWMVKETVCLLPWFLTFLFSFSSDNASDGKIQRCDGQGQVERAFCFVERKFGSGQRNLCGTLPVSFDVLYIYIL